MQEAITIKDKFDTESAQKIVDMGYPSNKKMLDDLIFWSCFPNDPVCHITYPFLATLKDDDIALPIIEFLEFNIDSNQMELIENAFLILVKTRGENFIKLLHTKANSERISELLDNLSKKYH